MRPSVRTNIYWFISSIILYIHTPHNHCLLDYGIYLDLASYSILSYPLAIYHSEQTGAHKTSSEVSTCVLVHLGEHEVVLVQLFADLLPESRLPGPQHLPDVSTIHTIVSNQVSVQLARNWPSETPPQENRVEDGHTDEIEPARCHSSVDKTYISN